MPPRKEPKESVVYPSSKRKTPAFKPLKPVTKVPRIATTDPESSVKSRPAAKKAPAKKPAAQSIPLESSDEDDDDLADLAKDDDSDSLGEDPLAVSKKKPQSKATTSRRPSNEAMSISSEHPNDPPDTTTSNPDPMPTQSDSTPSIPQPLLLRLLHEAFADKNTNIDTQAIQVFQKYVEVFVREAIARTKAEKEEAAEGGEVATQSDVGWLEVEDLEKVAPGLVLDFL
ncbi:hypothetical protein CLAFUW4_02538 [Fulvia fulva]|uniref:Uncharacterized protein n=1 Tax=Passalora fulva TaxID=5499 RepID=A0A9Q8LAZ2_PASFU|nr:uncharacterized protein CLAFUR5_02528 [Fulvia fulva]KAK4632415.1 hypothetical protein CLAFUR4_02533 [Fulvia fulva]KAK4633400.1 hypothetical protein CLAFUR0_02537 [Fulvia fulva]UJO14074.1 hypothetical protein CLAFUR5_02528 [Fulvia fulva]WPV11924.1 hypothetical protein CLAFUW4_02538 [Fulvia fulva]WPV25879.1 hypothetical protein CLAFUW7_02538 [Fulvia fulva]